MGKNQDHSPLEFSCSCGQLRGQIKADAITLGSHLECYCRDCRAAKLYFDQPDPAPGAVDLFQTTPDAITILTGLDRLGLFRLGPKGVMRWYATCCKTLIVSTPTTPRFPIAMVQVDQIANHQPIGPVVAKAFVPRPGGKSAHEGFGRIIVKLLPIIAGSLISGRWRQTPFFDDTGAPVAKAIIPTKQERAALYPAQRNING